MRKIACSLFRAAFHRRRLSFVVLLAVYIGSGGCTAVEISLVPDYSEPLQEYTLQGEGEGKILLIPVIGIMTTQGERGLGGAEPSVVQEVVSHLRKAAGDPKVKAVVLQIDSPGGSATASDVLYRELRTFKADNDVKVVAMLMNVAASGGYYAAVAADRIVAHPTTVTGSIGAIFVRPKITGLLDHIGVAVEVSKAGRLKDMGSPFREETGEEKRIFQEVLDAIYKQFVDVVAEERGFSAEEVSNVADGRIFIARQAMERGLVDRIGYLDDAFDEARVLAELPEDSRVVVYRRREFGDDNPYNTYTTRAEGGLPRVMELSLARFLAMPRTGFYYLWAPEFE